jgi:hypothetical protein
MKILPRGWRFSSKPGGLDLENPWWLEGGSKPPIFADLFY